jgi:hydroxyacylglutathione hydrolase
MRRVKAFFAIIVTIAILAAGAVVAMRVARQKASAPADVKPNLVAVASAGIYLFAARVGPHVVLFDSGADPGGGPIDAALAALGAGRADVTDLFLTHGHMDHTAGAALLDKAHVHLGAADVALAEGKIPPEALAAKIMNKVIPAPPITANSPLTGAASIDVGGGKSVKAVPVPGHTPGSYAFLYDGVLFVGDIMVFKQGQLEPPPALFDPHPAENRAAIRALKTALAGDAVDIVCTGHGGCTPKGLGHNLLDDLAGRLGT